MHRNWLPKRPIRRGSERLQRGRIDWVFGSLRDWLGSWTLSRSAESLGEGIFVVLAGWDDDDDDKPGGKKERADSNGFGTVGNRFRGYRRERMDWRR